MEVQTQTSSVPFDDILKSFDTTPKKVQDTGKRDFFEINENNLDTSFITNTPPLDDNGDDSKGDENKNEAEDTEVNDEPIVDEKNKLDTTTVVDNIIQNTKKAPTDEIELDGDSIDKLYRELVKNEVFEGFDDDKPVTKLEEIKLLIEENRKRDKQKVLEEELPQFVESLPDEVQAIVKYATEGGKDLKGMFKALAEVEEFREVEVTENNIRGQEEVAYKYLKATGYAKGDDAEIREQIEEWKDNGVLFKRSKRFKSELDEMSEQLVAQKLVEQEKRAKLEEQRSLQHKQQVYDSIVKDNNLNGIKLDKQIQNMLFAGLTQKAYDTEDGRKVDMLDALIEFHRVKQPNPKLLAEALYLLAKPDDYKEKMSQEMKVKEKAGTMRALKSEQSRRATSSPEPQKQGIKRVPDNNSFWLRK